ncbi:MAG: hypothetical protein ACKVQC_08830 [Elusimicrobiota bacterium]
MPKIEYQFKPELEEQQKKDVIEQVEGALRQGIFKYAANDSILAIINTDSLNRHFLARLSNAKDKTNLSGKIKLAA